jgi:CheY-like chemotaxis protein
MLEDEGCSTTTAHDGQEAVDLVKNRLDKFDKHQAALAAAAAAGEAVSADPNAVATALGFSSAPRSAQYDMIYSDVLMPILDGLSACRLIRELEAARGLEPIPVCAVSANALLHDRESCFEAGFTAHLSKPYNRKQVKKLLAARLPKRAATDSSRDPLKHVQPATFDEFNAWGR